MQYNNTTSQSGMVQMCEDMLGMNYGDISGNTKRLQRFTRFMNDRYGFLANRIWKASADWQFDDSNQATLPDATTDLVADQQDYELPSTAQKVERVEIKNQDGDYVVVRPFDEAQVPNTAMSEWYETAATPIYYDIKGRSLLLYPKPGTGYVTLTEGLKVYVSRDIVKFNSTATTQEPGFANNFHRAVPLGACIDYSVGKSMDGIVKNCIYLYNETIKDLEEFYARRHRNPPKVHMSPGSENYV